MDQLKQSYVGLDDSVQNKSGIEVQSSKVSYFYISWYIWNW